MASVTIPSSIRMPERGREGERELLEGRMLLHVNRCLNDKGLTSNLGVVSHANATFIIIRLHSDFSSTPGPVSKGGKGKHTE